MLYEKYNVRGKVRKDRGGKIQLHINLGMDSNFEKGKEVVVLYSDDFKKLEEQNQNQNNDQTVISELKNKIQELDSKNNKLKEELNNINLPELEENIKQLKEENNKLEKEIKEIDQEKLKKKIKELKTENKTLKEENTNLKKEINKPNPTNFETITELKSENNLLKQRNNDLTTQNTELKQNLDKINHIQLEKTITQLETENKNLKEKVEEIPHIIELEEQNKIEIRYISSQLDDERKKILALMVGIIDTYNRGTISRVRNTIPPSLQTAMDIKYLTGEKKLILDGEITDKAED